MHFLAERLRSQLHAMGEWPLRRSVLLSISGGRDSTTLLHAMIEAGIRPVLFHCNYLLRDEDSNQDEQLVAELAAQHGLILELLKVPGDWKKEIQQEGRNLQDAARRFRYHALRELSAPGGKYASAIVVTAHHAMDQAETILLAILKGRNIQRLCGLQSNRDLWRPWLAIMPSELEAYARDKSIRFRHDASNDSTAYDRNYLRNLVAPLLESRFPGWVQSCQRVTYQIQESYALVSEYSKRNLEPYAIAIQDPFWGNVLRLSQESRDIEHGSICARNLWRSMGANYTQENSLAQAWDLGVGKTLPCGKGQVFRQRNALCYFEGIPAEANWLQASKAQECHSEVWQVYAKLGHQFTVRVGSEAASDWGYWVAKGWNLRPWMPGDRCTLPGGYRKLVSDLLQENRVERPYKDTWPVICHQGVVVGCPLPSRSNRWDMEVDDGVLEWEWKASVNYVTSK